MGNFAFKFLRPFFKDKLVSVEKAVEVLKKCNNFNAVGPKIINALIEKKVIHPEGVLTIEEIPIALKFVF